VNSYTEYYEGYPEITIIMFRRMFTDMMTKHIPGCWRYCKPGPIPYSTGYQSHRGGEVKKTCDPEAIADFYT
jgi:hypothetical protein